MFELARADFEDAVADVLDSIPRDVARMMSNVVVLVQDEPPAYAAGVLGLYEGTPLTQRGDGWAGSLPDRITLFRLPILRNCGSRNEVGREIRITVLHELGHHFGLDDARLHELGWA